AVRGDRAPAALELALELELEPDLEHEEDEPDLREADEDRGRRGIEDAAEEIGREQAERARAEEDPGEDLARDVGLPEPASRDRDDEPRDGEHDDELDEEPRDELL